MADKKSVIGDLSGQEWAKPLIEIDWVDAEWESMDMTQLAARDEDRATLKQMMDLYLQLQKENATLRRQFVFQYEPKGEDKLPTESADFYYDMLVEVYDREPDENAKPVLQNLANLFWQLMKLNDTLQEPIDFWFSLAEDYDQMFLVEGELLQPDYDHYIDFVDLGENGEDYIDFLVRFGQGNLSE